MFIQGNLVLNAVINKALYVSKTTIYYNKMLQQINIAVR